MPKTYLNPPTLFPSQQHGFSQIVTSRGGTLVHLSGQTGWDADKQMGARDDLGEQMRRSLANIEIAVQTAGGTRNDIVSLRIYIVGDHIRHGQPIQEALRGFFAPNRLPASTWIGVQALASPDFVVEVEAVAVIE